MRYTEYHAGVAVIKDKNRLNDAIKKLAELEDKEGQQKKCEQCKTENILRECALNVLNEYCHGRYCLNCTFKYMENCNFSSMNDRELKEAYTRVTKNYRIKLSVINR